MTWKETLAVFLIAWPAVAAMVVAIRAEPWMVTGMALIIGSVVLGLYLLGAA